MDPVQVNIADPALRQQEKANDRRSTNTQRIMGGTLPALHRQRLLQETEMTQNKAASYAWVSSDDRQSIMAQLERIRKAADEQGLRVAREYEDEGQGGATDDRPGFQRMIADALSPEKPFDTIIVHDLSRFSSSVSVLIRYRDQLEEAGVRLLSATEGATSLVLQRQLTRWVAES